MAYYDEYSGMEVETEEERRKRLEEEASKVVHEQKVTTDASGNQTVETKQEVPSGQGLQPVKPTFAENLGNAVAAIPGNFVRNLQQAPENFQRNLQQGLTNLQNAPQNLVNNVQKAVTPVSPESAQPVASVAPGAIDQSQYTAQQESGGKTNIGYHFPQDEQGRRKSTAFGMYGLTAPAYQDVQKANPAFAGRDITTLTPEEQTQAYQTFTGLNTQRLQKLGVEPTEGAQRLAHLLGAGGAAKFLQTGEVSPAAAAANGGIENLKRIAGQRMAGQAAASSGAVNLPIVPQAQPGPGVAVATGQGVQGTMETPVAPVSPEAQPAVTTPAPNSFDEFGTPVYSAEAAKLQNHVDRFNSAQNNPEELMALGSDKTAPDWMRRRARDTVADLVIQERNQSQAQEALQNLGPNDMAKVLSKKSEGNSVGDWLQYLLYKHVGLNDLANEKGEQLGIGHKWTTAYIQDPVTGKDVPVEVQTSASGKLLKGQFAGTNKDLTPEQLTMAAGAVQNADALKTAQTQATHAYTQAYTSLMKQRDAMTQQGATEPDLAQRGLDMTSIQTRAQQAGKSVIDAARGGYRQPISQPAIAQAAPQAQNAPAAAPAQPQFKTETGKTSLLDNWNSFRPGEDAKAKAARTAIQPSEIDSAAQALVEGRVKPTEFTGRGSEFRRLATERALELDSKFTPMRYDQVNAVIKRYTSGKDHEVLLNTGTAVNHLAQFKDIAQQTPGNTNVSSWNTFYQNLTKYGNAPELKSKEAMAGFVAGELVKAASGGHGSMTERTHLEGQLMKANTPAEIVAIVDNSIKLAHGRYSSMKASYEGSTGRKDFDSLVGMPEEAKREFGKIEGHEAIKNQGSEAEKWARANPDDPRSKDILKRLGKQ